jgi:hypothetical protein
VGREPRRKRHNVLYVVPCYLIGLVYDKRPQTQRYV